MVLAQKGYISMLLNSFNINNKYKINKNSKCFIIAEIGINHNGSLEIGKKLIKNAKIAGADAVKFQNYDVDDFIKDKKSYFKYNFGKKVIKINEYDMFKSYQLTENDFIDLKKYCDEINIIFLSTPTNEIGINFLKKIKAPLLKNGSDFLTNLSLIKHMATSKIPTILSTGMSNVSEIDDAVNTFIKFGGKKLILLHCTSQYPTPNKEINLKKITFLQKRYNCPIGFSDHSDNSIASTMAVALNAKIVEKHFTLNKNLLGPDHKMSSNPHEFKKMVEKIRSNEEILGSGTPQLSKNELISRGNYRLSAYFNANLVANTSLSEKHIIFRRPGLGLTESNVKQFFKKKINRNVKKNQLVMSKFFND